MQLFIDMTADELRGGAQPMDLKLGEDCKLPSCLDLIELVARRWKGKGTTRQHERRATVKTVGVVRGLAAVVARLKEETQPATLELTEKWSLENESVGGYGALLNADEKIGVKAGMLVGLKLDGEKNITVNVARRIRRKPGDKVYVGLQTLGRAAFAVQLHAMKVEPSDAPPIDAIYLPELPQAGSNRTLIVSHSTCIPGSLWKLKSQDKAYTISLQQIVEHNTDYTQFNFSVLAKS